MLLPSADGKINAAQVKELYESHIRTELEHTVQPGMVYISHPTELGTIYTRAELEELYAVCRECGMYLFVDGAHLAYALEAEGNDVELTDLAANCDVFYIGGTKVGALFGEAVVIMNNQLKKDFRYMIKQRGGMLAKGRLLGLQFAELFTGRALPRDGPPCGPPGGQDSQRLRRQGIPALRAEHHQPDFPGDSGRRSGVLEGQIHLHIPVPCGQ